MSSADRDPITALAVFLAGQPTAVARLLADHVDDGHGHCRTCAVGGQRGNHAWPCSLHVAATASRDLRSDRADRDPGRLPRTGRVAWVAWWGGAPERAAYRRVLRERAHRQTP
ncbi:MAG: hypothetical protein ACRDRK_27770 [Pseudonocardia sp.]